MFFSLSFSVPRQLDNCPRRRLLISIDGCWHVVWLLLYWSAVQISVYGLLQGADFAVPDTIVDNAFSALLHGGRTRCKEKVGLLAWGCTEYPSPAAHMSDDAVMSLCQKSRVSGIEDPDLMLATSVGSSTPLCDVRPWPESSLSVSLSYSDSNRYTILRKY